MTLEELKNNKPALAIGVLLLLIALVAVAITGVIGSRAQHDGAPATLSEQDSESDDEAEQTEDLDEQYGRDRRTDATLTASADTTEPFAPYSEPADPSAAGTGGAATGSGPHGAGGAVDAGSPSAGGDPTDRGDEDRGGDSRDGGADDGGGQDPVPAGVAAVIVRHEVWGGAVGGVRVGLPALGSSAVTGSDGTCSIASVPAGSALVAVDTQGGAWRSYSALERRIEVPPRGTGIVEFRVYRLGEAFGTTWWDAAAWRRWLDDAPDDQVAVLATRVAAASAEFSQLTGERVGEILRPGQRGSAREKARAEYLALWLDLASARLGFDTVVDVGDARALVPSADSDGMTSVLSLARDLDALFASGTGDWAAVRRLCSGASAEIVDVAGAASSASGSGGRGNGNGDRR